MGYNWVCCKKYDWPQIPLFSPFKKTRESPSHSGDSDWLHRSVTWHNLTPKVLVCHLSFGGSWAFSANIIWQTQSVLWERQCGKNSAILKKILPMFLTTHLPKYCASVKFIYKCLVFSMSFSIPSLGTKDSAQTLALQASWDQAESSTGGTRKRHCLRGKVKLSRKGNQKIKPEEHIGS